ncbi:HdeA/HdeB family chaperone [Chelatococcus reniformis]|uniref:Acid stress chaperone HdeA n=1 Tax=Chelatococcus reniformis TaxID=1494448 RepID=A0A916X7D7_9HYPH|nr:HdeA/HdeB family chaperone [Chelatococcus reniformis]GGC51037.1 hypothetical protein GCM10010994_07730 [Chelatococcus reniformis]
MTYKALIAAAAFGMAGAAPASAQVVVDMTQITCGEFLKATPDQQATVAAWMSGYFSASRNIDMVDLRYVERNAKVVGGYCEKHQSERLLSAVEKNAK